MRIGLIVAMDRKRAIGRDNALPWHLPDDLRRFKALTLGKPVLMGRRTAESLGRALPGRTNLVLTRGDRIPFAGMREVASLDQAQAIAQEEGAGELCVIGGAQVYALALPRATDLRMTHVETVVADADTFFPAYEAAEWTPVSRVRRDADARHRFAFEFVDYVRAAPAVSR
ncbi:dihydrofolate reductase [Luteimonas sp. SDU82]|uniref:dihydrofolate reductase n=1 Tax=Luteimonas sp. SDU82 TaxID=3422592 RepID=UPI003EC09B77